MAMSRDSDMFQICGSSSIKHMTVRINSAVEIHIDVTVPWIGQQKE